MTETIKIEATGIDLEMQWHIVPTRVPQDLFLLSFLSRSGDSGLENYTTDRVGYRENLYYL